MAIRPGEFIAVIGRNASGKSTLTKLLNGLLVPCAGDVLVDGLNTRDQNQLIAIRQRVGLLFSDPENQLVASIVEEDVAFGPENLGLPSNIIEDRVQRALAVVGMESRRKDSLYHLSGGEKQRVAIAGVLALQPRYMVLDEPTSMLDPRGREEVIQTLIRLNREEKTGIIMVTHFPEEAISADRVVVLDQGRITMQGSPMDILTDHGQMEQAGLETPEIVLLADALRLRGYSIPPVLQVDQLVEILRENRLTRSGNYQNG